LERAALRREPRTRTRSRGGMARPAATPWRPHPRRGRAARRAGRARSLPRARPPEARRRGPSPSPNGSPGSRTPSAPRALFAGVEWWTGSLEVESSGPPARASEARSDGSRGLVGKLLETEEVAETRRRSRVFGRRERFSSLNEATQELGRACRSIREPGPPRRGGADGLSFPACVAYGPLLLSGSESRAKGPVGHLARQRSGHEDVGLPDQPVRPCRFLTKKKKRCRRACQLPNANS